jgi:ubiquinone/menaquinone biosynthesis C-methylase UbiE
MALDVNAVLKSRVKAHWEDETCGTRYGSPTDRKRFFEEISKARYRLEPYIAPFADFPGARGQSVLEIGVGAGADFENWCRFSAHATGVDLTERAIALTAERLQLNQVPPGLYDLRTADAEQLPFADASFDLIYSWGVLHHTPDTQRAFGEVYRVLKPGGRVKAMIYHVPSWCGFMLYLQHGLLRGNWRMTMKEALYAYLESPGTKAYTLAEARALLSAAGFVTIKVSSKLSFGDLLMVEPSAKYRSPIFKLAWRIYPRWLVRLLGDRYGLGLLIEASKAS